MWIQASYQTGREKRKREDSGEITSGSTGSTLQPPVETFTRKASCEQATENHVSEYTMFHAVNASDIIKPPTRAY